MWPVWPFMSRDPGVEPHGRMLKSLLIKLGLLAVTAGLALWIGWPVEDRPVPAPDPSPITISVQPVIRDAPASLPNEKLSPMGRDPQRVDLNRATVEQLQHLPGLGTVLARRVIERRTQRGPYRRVEDLLQVKGIGAKRLAQLHAFVVVGADHTPGRL